MSRDSASPDPVPPVVGLIAGNGLYPETFARAARRAGVERLVMAAFTNETKPEVESLVDATEWLRVGQLGRMIRFFKSQDVRHAVMVGQIAPRNLFDLRPDFRALALLARLKQRNAESLFGGIGSELAKDGIELLSAVAFLEDELAPAGLIAGPKPKPRRWHDAEYGFGIAKETSRLDIGQTVLVKFGTVLAVEAFEGTNAAIERGGRLGRNDKVTLVKVSKPAQDFRFDVPVIGPDTITTAHAAGVDLVAVEAGRTLILGRTELLELAGRLRVTVLGLGANPDQGDDPGSTADAANPDPP